MNIGGSRLPVAGDAGTDDPKALLRRMPDAAGYEVGCQASRWGPSVKTRRLWLAAILAGALVAPMVTSAQVKGVLRPESSALRLPADSEFPSLAGTTGWLNSPPLTAAELRGKVVLIVFWTYTCINWRRSLPYVRAWSEKYKDHGLVVIGVHSPEFEFEKDFGNIRWAIRDMGLIIPSRSTAIMRSGEPS